MDSAFNEVAKVLVEYPGMGREHAVREAGINLQNPLLGATAVMIVLMA